MPNFSYTKEYKGVAPHDYYMYTIKYDQTNTAGYNFHITVPISDRVTGSIGTYPHISVTEIKGRGKKKKWRTLAETLHWYVVWVPGAAASEGVNATDSAYKPQDKYGAGITLSAPDLLLFNKCVADMKGFGCLPWKAHWA